MRTLESGVSPIQRYTIQQLLLNQSNESNEARDNNDDFPEFLLPCTTSV